MHTTSCFADEEKTCTCIQNEELPISLPKPHSILGETKGSIEIKFNVIESWNQVITIPVATYWNQKGVLKSKSNYSVATYKTQGNYNSNKNANCIDELNHEIQKCREIRSFSEHPQQESSYKSIMIIILWINNN